MGRLRPHAWPPCSVGETHRPRDGLASYFYVWRSETAESKSPYFLRCAEAAGFLPSGPFAERIVTADRAGASGAPRSDHGTHRCVGRRDGDGAVDLAIIDATDLRGVSMIAPLDPSNRRATAARATSSTAAAPGWAAGAPSSPPPGS